MIIIEIQNTRELIIFSKSYTMPPKHYRTYERRHGLLESKKSDHSQCGLFHLGQGFRIMCIMEIQNLKGCTIRIDWSYPRRRKNV